MHRAAIMTTVLTLLAAPAFAVGSDDDTPPKPTETSTQCEEGKIWDAKTETCVGADQQSFSDDDRYGAVRELAYAGAYDRALTVIAAADAPDASRFLTYRGFIARKTGDMDTALNFYSAALVADPDNLLTRSYMGMGLAELGDHMGAREQLREIEARGGKGSWSYTALERTLAGLPSDY